MGEVKVFNKEQVAFAIVNGKVMYSCSSELSHIGWLVGGGIVTAEEFVNITRGYYRDGALTFYSGNFQGGTLVERDALDYLDIIKSDLKLERVNSIYCGLVDDNTTWQPIKQISIPVCCSSIEWGLCGVLERLELVEDYLDAVWNNDILLNLRLVRDKHKPIHVKQNTLEELELFKGRLNNTWCEDNPIYLEKINSCIERLERVYEILEIVAKG